MLVINVPVTSLVAGTGGRSVGTCGEPH